MSHQNWFLTIVEKNIIPIVWLALFVSLSLTAATYMIVPVYSAKTELILDASLDKVLPSLKTGLPSTKLADYIRYEYFAINSVNLMQQPAIGEKVISENHLLDGSGEKLNVNDFVNPSVLNLIFSTNGQGITVKWISDTQQFSITGYGKDINIAALISSKYTDAFIEYDKKQFQNILENLSAQRLVVRNNAINKRLQVEKDESDLREKYGITDWDSRITSLTTSLATVEDDIHQEKIDQSTYKERLSELDKQLNELKLPISLSRIDQKNPRLSSLELLLTDLVQQLAVASIEFTPIHPDYQKIQKKIDTVHQQILKESQSEYSQSTSSTSGTLDDILKNIMEARKNNAIHTIKLSLLNEKKTKILKELNFLGDGKVLYSDLEDQKKSLNTIINTAEQDIDEIKGFIEKPFSFYRSVSEPFIDMKNIVDAKYMPLRKWTLILSFLGMLIISFFYILIRELHLETLFYAWQLRQLPDGVESIDIVCNKTSSNNLNSTRHIFNSLNSAGNLVRIRKLDNTSDPGYIAELGAEYFLRSGETTLLVNNCKVLEREENLKKRGLHSWLIGNTEELLTHIFSNQHGYDMLSDTDLNPMAPWVKTMTEIKEMFSTFFRHYYNVILLESSMHTGRRLVGDALAPDLDILTVKEGMLSVNQIFHMIQREQQTSKAKRTIILVMNNKESINLFSIKGCFNLLVQFLVFPSEMVRSIRS